MSDDAATRVVTQLWRYPVKSLQGERLEAATIGPRGIVGDRLWATVDRETGLTLTGRRAPEPLFASAATVDDGVRVTLPEGTVPAEPDRHCGVVRCARSRSRKPR